MRVSKTAAIILVVLLSFALSEGPEAVEANAGPKPIKAAPKPDAFPQATGGPPLGYTLSPPRFIGSIYCYACHQDLALEFSRTVMGKLFLVTPQNDLERKGCEGCHGPGSNHAASGGGSGIGGLIEYRIDRGQSIKTANQACLECHDEAFWGGKTHGLRRLACFDCHTIMQRDSPSFQLSAAVTDSWNRARTWIVAMAAGLIAGILVGTFRRIRGGSEKG